MFLVGLGLKSALIFEAIAELHQIDMRNIIFYEYFARIKRKKIVLYIKIFSEEIRF